MAAVASAPVVAGVDGTSDGRVATRYAAELADRLGRGLTLLHAYHRSAVLNPLLPIVDPRASGQATLAVAHAAYAPSLNAGIMRSAGEHIPDRRARRASSVSNSGGSHRVGPRLAGQGNDRCVGTCVRRCPRPQWARRRRARPCWVGRLSCCGPCDLAGHCRPE